MPTPAPRIVDAKITHVNGGLTVCWKFDNDTWCDAPHCHYTVPEDICNDPEAIVEWCQNYKNAYNAGKDVEEQTDHAEGTVPSEVTDLIGQSLNLE